MNARVKKKITLMLDAEVYAALQDKVGARKVGDYLSRLARPHVVITDLAASYQALAADSEQSQIAAEWETGTDVPIEAENVWHL